MFWLSEAYFGDPVENPTRDRTISYTLQTQAPDTRVLNSINPVAISHVGNSPSSWYSVWTPPPQLPGNSQVCSSPQLPGNSQVGPAHYKRSCLPLLTLLFSYSLASLLPSWALPIPSPFHILFPPLSMWTWTAPMSLLSPSVCLSLTLLPS